MEDIEVLCVKHPVYRKGRHCHPWWQTNKYTIILRRYIYSAIVYDSHAPEFTRVTWVIVGIETTPKAITLRQIRTRRQIGSGSQKHVATVSIHPKHGWRWHAGYWLDFFCCTGDITERDIYFAGDGGGIGVVSTEQTKAGWGSIFHGFGFGVWS